MIDYKGIRDCHLNIYWQYDGKPYLENNITKAFINSIDSLLLEDKVFVINSLFEIEIDKNDVEFEYYLQKQPSKQKVESFAKENRIMFAFSPEGECWGFAGQDTKNEKQLFEAIKKELTYKIKDEEILKEETKKAVNEYLDGKRGDSIPDAWILIYKNKKPAFIIAIENKLHKLDPNQINNHIEKSLLILENKPKVIYKKYSDIIDIFKGLNSFNTDQFIEYLTILGYVGVEDFITACSANKTIRKKLAIPFGKGILSKIHVGKIDNRKWNVCRLHVSYDYLREINMIFDDDTIRFSLAFGSTQSSGKRMLEKINDIKIDMDHVSTFKQSFHLLYQRGRNIVNSYIDQKISISEYIKYWKNNISLIKSYTPLEAIELYQKMLNDKVISISNFERLKCQLVNKKNRVLVVPEIIIEYCWNYDEISKIGYDLFIDEVKLKLDETLNAVSLK
mgnify:CR=1 FL=1